MSDSGIKEYPEISDFGYIKDDKVYLKGYLGFKDREIGVVRESDEESMRYFLNRFEMVEKKVNEVKEAIVTAENKGSYLMKLIHMRTYLAQFNGLGDFTKLYEEINNMEDDIRVYIEKNRQKNYEIKTALLNEANSFKGSADWKFGAEKLKELKLKWIKTGSAHKEVEEQLSKEFNEALEYFFQRRKSFFLEQAKVIKDAKRRAQYIINDLTRINQAGSDPAKADKVKSYQREWRTFSKVPKKIIAPMFSSFKKQIDTYFNNLKYNAAMKEKSSIEIKQDIYTEVENMLEGKARFDINFVKQLQLKWKQFGKLPNPEDKQLNLKFRIVCNELFEMHFLEKSTRYFHPDFPKKTFSEQIKLKMQVLQDSIDKDEQELEDYSKKYAFELAQDSRTPGNYPVFQQRNNYVNKLKTKHRILSKLQDKLNPSSRY
ncbi:DUF349 domain-containing protein [Flammeovirgaceae bacterium SG7u.111]|nr:DUF349 domain-containing protein [Flammeovirgaceae bacterium SG7u.132]WPO35793.1 DUF349 domain-containing protein [Flammeovirgaceae bacterium SG7u.111]